MNAEAALSASSRSGKSAPFTSKAEVIYERCAALVPMLREHGQEGEKRSSLHPEVLEALREAGALTMAWPRQFGGAALMPSEQARIVEVIARGDGGAGWCVQIGAASTMMAACLASLELQEEMFSTGRGPIAAGKAEPRPGCVAREVDGGWMIKGKWSFASGLDYTEWVTGGVIFEKGDGSKFPGVFYMPKQQEWVVDDWHVMGMAASSSASFEFKEEVFVPAYRCSSLAPIMAGVRPKYAAEQPLFNADLASHAQLLSLATAFGCYSAVRELWEDITRKRAQMHPDFKLQAENPITHLKAGGLGAFSALVRTVIDKLAESTDLVALGQHKLTTLEMLENNALGGQILFEMADKAMGVMRDSGAGTISLSHPMQRAVRDVLVSNMHALSNRDRHFESLGRHLYGLPPIFAFG